MQRWISIAVCLFVALLLFAVIAPATRQARESAGRSQVKNNLKQLGLALHNYHDVFDCFPPGATVDDSGRAHHGWFTFLLPYQASSPLYSWIDFDYPWEHPVNRDLFCRPYFYGELNPGTSWNGTKEGFAVNHYAANPRLLHRNSSVSISDITSGTSHSWAIGEAGGNFVPWAYPFNWREFDGTVGENSDGFGLAKRNGTHMLIADGRVKFFSENISPHVAKELSRCGTPIDPALTAKPDRPFELIQRSNWGRLLKLDHNSESNFSPMVLEITTNPDGMDVAARFCWFDKHTTRRALKLTDIETLVTKCPNVRAVIGPIELDEANSRLLSQLRHLEVLRVIGVEDSEPVLLNIKSFPHLRMLVVGKSETEKLDALRAQLPGIEILTSREWF
ncbi:DUF1559 family PulG-like putative transporter [Planctomicrobium piriforme]|uniref:DUF1559 domain-containing protein n=1 Tax=Planctomicrobium piriforme TaxID=1576369 RepID=A0A1I3ATM6_9PLAN|nr:DUF1559 domain-containing protein [Planctomicrobium piriforme]SFH53069.1 Protein of unknown function [Planctomicrobium piriforme]